MNDPLHARIRHAQVLAAEDVVVEHLRAMGLADAPAPRDPAHWPDPTPEMLADPVFDRIWQAIKSWDIGVPDVYDGYCGATGNHVRAILDAIRAE